VAKEQARALLPEGLTPSRLYMTGTLRSFITYCQVRMDPSTQLEHRLVAQDVLAVLRDVAPVTVGAFFPLENV
jgi:thymidylate synthase (FAD)